jgi:hypothetical protein
MAKGKHRRRPAGTNIAAYSILEFCDAHGISTRMYYVLRKRKEAPREMKIGRRVLISQEAAAAWRAEREG